MKICLKIFLFFFGILAPAVTKAVCPLCTAAVAGGVGLARWLKIDDTISGIWVGGFTLSLSLWLVEILKKKGLFFRGALVLYPVTLYLLVYLPLYFTEIIGHPANKIVGIDKLILGGILGSAAFLLGLFFDQLTRKSNQEKVLFPYQKVVFPVSLLVITSLILYLIIK